MLCRLFVEDRHKVQVEMLLRLSGRFCIRVAHENITIQTHIVRFPIHRVIPNAEIGTIDIPINRHNFSKEIKEVLILYLV